MMEKNENKKVNFTIRIDKDLKDKFIKACKAIDTDSSKEIRKFIKNFLNKEIKKK